MGKRSSRLISVCLVWAICLIIALPVLAATINVNSTADDLTAGDGNCTLREAINNSNNDNDSTGGDCTAGDASPDTINVPAGTYRTTITGAGEDLNATGDFDLLDDVRIFGVQGAEATIQGSRSDRVFHLDNSVTAFIQDLIITGGNSPNTGGGILNGLGSLTLTRVTVTENKAAGNAGGVGCIACQLIIQDSFFTKNVADSDGNGNGSGGAIGGVTGGVITIDNTIIGDVSGSSNPRDKNTAVNGAGISVIANYDVTITNSTISANEATNDGGGFFHVNTSGTLPDFNFSNTTFSGNSAGNDGGAIFIDDNSAANPTLFLANTTITNNTADSDSDGAGDGGGIHHEDGDIEIQNTIVAGNFDPSSSPDCSGIFDSLGNNLIGANDGCAASFAVGFPNGNDDFVGTEANPIDPNLEALALSPPGTTPVHIPQADSIAIDNGDATACANAPVNNLDQRGVTRPQTFGTLNLCDIGAVELQRFERFSSTQSIRVSSGFNVPFHCGDKRVTFFNGGDQVESVERNETIVLITYPESRINSSPSSRDQAQVIQSPTLVSPSNFLNPGVMSVHVLATLNPGKSYRIACEDLRLFPTLLDADGNVAETIVDALSVPAAFFQGVLTIESTKAIVVSAKKIKRSWIINDGGSTPAYSDGEQVVLNENYESSRASGSREVDFFVSKASLPTNSASASTQVFGPPKPEVLKLAIQVLSRPGNSSIEFRTQGISTGKIGVQIYGLNGREIFSNEQSGSRLKWNLRDQNQRPVANGVYLYVVTMRGPNRESLIRTAVKKLVVMR